MRKTVYITNADKAVSATMPEAQVSTYVDSTLRKWGVQAPQLRIMSEPARFEGKVWTVYEAVQGRMLVATVYVSTK